MKRFLLSTIVALALAGAFGPAAPALAQDAGHGSDEPYPVPLRVGEVFRACLSGQIECPARAPICDDPNVAVPVETPDGLGFKAVGPGTTLCSAASTNNQRRVFRITVP